MALCMHTVIMHVALQGNTGYKLSTADSAISVAKDVAEQKGNDQGAQLKSMPA